MTRNDELTSVVVDAVDKSADAAERIHKAVARLPLNLLQRAELIGKAAADFEKRQDHSIGAVYDLVRGINHEVGRLAERLAAGPAQSKPARSAAKAA